MSDSDLNRLFGLFFQMISDVLMLDSTVDMPQWVSSFCFCPFFNAVAEGVNYH